MQYEALLRPARLGPIRLRNRIMSSAHQTTLVRDNRPTEAFFSYHLARAAGGVGLVVLEAHAVDESGLRSDHTLDASSEAIVDAYRPFAREIREEGARLFVQLLHAGREIYDSEYAPPPPAPSAVPTERHHAIPRPLETAEVYDLIDAFANAADRLTVAGVDGVEIGCSHGYLPAQFWSPHTNRREDEFGGDLRARCRFTTQIVDRVRGHVGDDLAVGIRFSAEERHQRGLTFDETLRVVEHIDDAVDLDYWSAVVGSSSTYRSCNYIVPPATTDDAIVTSPGAVLRGTVDPPVIITSRIDTPEKGDAAVRNGMADVVGMTRALIADPDLPRKIESGARANVTPCVACNQGCIGRYQQGLPIRCTVNPVTGRERDYRDLAPVDVPKDVLIVGGGPAGMMAASTAAQRGHNVTLVEAADRLGGQVLAYADLAHRGRFEEWIDVLSRRVDDAGVDVHLGTRFEADDLDAYAPDVVVLATGARGRAPDIPVAERATTATAIEALQRPAAVASGRIVISDWDGNAAALDVAAVLCDHDEVTAVEVVTTAYTPGEAVQQYVRNSMLGELYDAGVTFTPHHRVSRVGNDSVELTNVFTETVVSRPEADGVVFSHAGEAEYALFRSLRTRDVALHRVGDCWAPRTLDEATWEGYRTVVGL